MGSWDIESIGIIIQEQKYKALGEELFEFIGYDLVETDADYRYDAHVVDKNVDYPEDLYVLFNKVFGATVLTRIHEVGNNTSDYNYILKETYNPLKKTLTVCETDYCYGDNTVFGKDIDVYYKDEIERAAREKGIEPDWTFEDDEFADFYQDIRQDIIYDKGTRYSTEPIPDDLDFNWKDELGCYVSEGKECSKELYDLLVKAFAPAEWLKLLNVRE